MVKILKPNTILVYSYTPDEIFLSYKQAGINIVSFENYTAFVKKGGV